MKLTVILKDVIITTKHVKSSMHTTFLNESSVN